jgi:hypothetical protein
VSSFLRGLREVVGTLRPYHPAMDEVITYLNRHGTETSQIRLFEVWISDSAVRVELHDRGQEADAHRYHAEAFSPDIPEAKRVTNSYGYSIGGDDATVQGALVNVHWDVFKSAE